MFFNCLLLFAVYGVNFLVTTLDTKKVLETVVIQKDLSGVSSASNDDGIVMSLSDTSQSHKGWQHIGESKMPLIAMSRSRGSHRGHWVRRRIGKANKSKHGRGKRKGKRGRSSRSRTLSSSNAHPVSGQKIRLRGSDKVGEGRVEVFKDGRWGLICDDHWDIEEAHVACRQLGFVNGALSAETDSVYGSGEYRRKDILIDEMECRGNEDDLLSCAHSSQHDCNLLEVAGVKCTPNPGCPSGWLSANGLCYRLIPHPRTTVQRANEKCAQMDAQLLNLESQQENDFVSDWLFTQTEEPYIWTGGMRKKVRSAEMWKWLRTTYAVNFTKWFPGWPPANSQYQPSNHSGQDCVTLARKFYNSEQKMQAVDYYFWNDAACSHQLPFICEKVATGAPDCYEGSGESYWGSVFRSDRGTLCEKWTLSSHVNPETHPDKGLGDHNFCRNPDNDTRPWCWVDAVRVKFGYCALPSCAESVHSTVQSQLPDYTDVSLAGSVTPPTDFRSEQRCSKYEFHCEADSTCIPLRWYCDGDTDCSDGQDEADCVNDLASFTMTSNHKLVAPSSGNTHYQATHNSVTPEKCAKLCVRSRSFVCRSFNFHRDESRCILLAENLVSGHSLTESEDFDYYELKSQAGNCSKDDFQCDNGKCISQSELCNGYDNCNDFSDENNCTSRTSSLSVRLVGGNSEHEGRVEVQYLGEWGVICDDHWDKQDANVVCKQLGYKGAVREAVMSEFGAGDANFLLDEVECTGSESSLSECQHDPWRTHNCRPYEVAGVVCSAGKVCGTDDFHCESGGCVSSSVLCDDKQDCPDSSDERSCDGISIRLVNGNSEKEGRVEVIRNGVPGTVCNDNWDDRDAQVVCRMLGFSGRAVAVETTPYGQGTGVIWLDDVDCNGSEQSLDECRHSGWAQHNCGHNEDVGVVCGAAPLPDENTPPPPPAQEPTDGAEVTCGLRPITPPTARIFGGRSAVYGAYPWQAAILKREFFSYTHWCGSTILNENWILSAAHCFVNQPKYVFRVRVGDNHKSRHDTVEQQFEVDELITHPRYSYKSHNNDIALLKVRPVGGSGIQFSRYVQPACLPSANTVYSSDLQCHISGWGSIGWSWFGHRFPQTLQGAVVPILPRHVCKRLLRKYTLTPEMICAGYIHGKTDTCQGDSGGPLVCQIDGVYTVLGVISWGQGCARAYSPGVYVNVKQFITWIDATMSKLNNRRWFGPGV